MERSQITLGAERDGGGGSRLWVSLARLCLRGHRNLSETQQCTVSKALEPGLQPSKRSPKPKSNPNLDQVYLMLLRGRRVGVSIVW